MAYKRNEDAELSALTDNDYAGDIEDRKSTSDYVFLLSFGAISRGSNKQPIVTLSTAEGEFVVAIVCACQAIWIKRVLKELGHEDDKCMYIKCDNNSTIKLSKPCDAWLKQTYRCEVSFLKKSHKGRMNCIDPLWK